MTPHKAYLKAYVAGKRLSELEDIIIDRPSLSYHYAKNVIKGRWVEAEDIIMTDALWSYHYAKYVIKGKLPENMHNMMILHAIEDPNYYAIKQYFEYIQ